MLQVIPKFEKDLDSRAASPADAPPLVARESIGTRVIAPQTSGSAIPAPQHKSDQPSFPASTLAEDARLRARVPVILGEASFRGTIPVDGIISGQPGNGGGSMSLRQNRRALHGSSPELHGELTFVDMIRVNGHIAGTVLSKKGTLIVDQTARVDAHVDVAIAIIAGIVTGDIVAHQRVEVAPSAKIYGNIWTHSLSIQDGAIFEGVCQMLGDKQDS